jgi:hypothetical protein
MKSVKMMMSENQSSNHKSMQQHFGVLRVKHQKAGLNRWPCWGEGSVLAQHQSRDSETDNHCNTRDGSSDRPRALLQISFFFSRICSTQYFTILFWGWGRRRTARINSGDTILVSKEIKNLALLFFPHSSASLAVNGCCIQCNYAVQYSFILLSNIRSFCCQIFGNSAVKCSSVKDILPICCKIVCQSAIKYYVILLSNFRHSAVKYCVNFVIHGINISFSL